jgi:ADP-ribose pyrophosphatase YjhB (NUDIX family)
MQEGRDRQVCSECGYIFYQNPAPAVGVIVVEEGKVLLVQRKFEPRKGGWTLPAGFVEYEEHVEDCAVRELKEETNLDVELTGLFGAYSAMDDPRVRVVLLLYTGRRTGGDLRAGDDAVDARFFSIDQLPEPIAFKAHVQALADVKSRLFSP